MRQRALEHPDVGLDLLGQVLEHVAGDVDLLGLGLLLQNGHAGLDVRAAQVGQDAHLQPAAQPVVHDLQLPRRGVGGDDDLLVVHAQGVEGVEELLFGGRALDRGDELDVVHEPHIHVAVAAAEFGDAVVADGRDELVDEVLGRDVDHLHLRVLLADAVADGLHQVGLAQTGLAVDEQWIVAAARDCGRPAGRRHARSGCSRPRTKLSKEKRGLSGPLS